MAGRQVTRALGQQRERTDLRPAQVGQQFLDAKLAQTRGGQFNRQGNPIQPATDLQDGARLAGERTKPGSKRCTVVTKSCTASKPAKSSAGRGRSVERVERRYHKGRQRILIFATHVQRRTAGDQHFDGWAAGKQFTDIGGGIDHLLEVVEHKQHALVAQHRGQVHHQRAAFQPA